jgi:nitronate monooxygenase
MNFGSGGNAIPKAWKDIWGCGQGISVITDVVPTRSLVDRLTSEYTTAKSSLY